MELVISQNVARLIVKLTELRHEVEEKRQRFGHIEEVEEEIMQLQDSLDILCRRLAELL
ncbi:MAG: hypothetical protein ACM3O9_08345 [Methylocystaceae bacterium]